MLAEGIAVRSRRITCVATVLAAAAVGAADSPPPPVPPDPIGTIMARTTLCAQPGRYIGWPTIARAANGELLAVFSGDREAHVSPDGKTQFVRSADRGATWSAPVTINDSPIDDRDAGIVCTPKGTLIVSWFTGPPYHTDLQGCFVMRSTDHGRTWGAPIRTHVSAPHGPVALADGRLLYLGQMPHCSHVKPPDYNGAPAGAPYAIAVEESRDDGVSWQLLARFPVPDDAKMLSFDEPHLVETTARTLVALFRDCNPPNRLRQSESRDGGRTWSAPIVTPIHGYPPHLIRLRNDWLLVSYAKRWPPFGTYACVSKDHGKTWLVERELRLSQAFDGDLGYPASVELEDGSLWTVYYERARAGEKPCLMGTHWKLAE